MYFPLKRRLQVAYIVYIRKTGPAASSLPAGSWRFSPHSRVWAACCHQEGCSWILSTKCRRAHQTGSIFGQDSRLCRRYALFAPESRPAIRGSPGSKLPIDFVVWQSQRIYDMNVYLRNPRITQLAWWQRLWLQQLVLIIKMVQLFSRSDSGSRWEAVSWNSLGKHWVTWEKHIVSTLKQQLESGIIVADLGNVYLVQSTTSGSHAILPGKKTDKNCSSYGHSLLPFWYFSSFRELLFKFGKRFLQAFPGFSFSRHPFFQQSCCHGALLCSRRSVWFLQHIQAPPCIPHHTFHQRKQEDCFPNLASGLNNDMEGH